MSHSKHSLSSHCALQPVSSNNIVGLPFFSSEIKNTIFFCHSLSLSSSIAEKGQIAEHQLLFLCFCFEILKNCSFVILKNKEIWIIFHLYGTTEIKFTYNFGIAKRKQTQHMKKWLFWCQTSANKRQLSVKHGKCTSFLFLL